MGANSGVMHLDYWIDAREGLDPDESLGAHQSGPQDQSESVGERLGEKAEDPTSSANNGREGRRQEGQNWTARRGAGSPGWLYVTRFRETNSHQTASGERTAAGDRSYADQA